jgi:hypothetical protein
MSKLQRLNGNFSIRKDVSNSSKNSYSKLFEDDLKKVKNPKLSGLKKIIAKKFPERIKTVKTNPVIEKTQAAVNTEIDKFLMKKKIKNEKI